jgi:hypothetical protein
MTDTTEVLSPEYASLALPAGTAAVFVEGVLCAELEPVEVVRGGWPDFGRATLRVTAAFGVTAGARCASPPRPGQIEDRFPMGAEVSLRQVFNRAGPKVAPADLTLFIGQIERVETRIGPEGQTVQFTVRDFSGVMERITVYGRHVGDGAGGSLFLPGLDTTFNPGGRDNAAVEPIEVNGQSYLAFCASDTEAKAWTCASVINYLLSVYLPTDQLHRPGMEQLLALTQGRLVRDLDLSGLNLLDALHRCCEVAGLQFRFAPRLVETGPRQAVVFYPNGRGRAVELNCQTTGQGLSLSKTNIASLQGRRGLYPVTHRYIGQGDFKMYEATFELVKAWDPALEGADYDLFGASTNPEFHKVRDVYRKWCLNEAGDYSGPPYNQGPAYALTGVFESEAYVRQRRRFWPTLSAGMQGKSLGYFLEVSFDGGEQWWQYFHAFNNLLDEAGVWLSSDQLDVNTWVAALKSVLRFRITASVISDERLTCIAADGPVGSAAPVVDHVITLPRRFQYRKVSARSVLKGRTEGFGPADEVDDSAAVHDFVRQQATASAAIIETIDLQTPTLALHFQPGDRVTASPDSRDFLDCRRDPRSLTWIDRVRVDFTNQCTHLKIVRQRPSRL